MNIPIKLWTKNKRMIELKKINNIKTTGGINMEILIKNNFKEVLDKISSKLVVLEGKDGMIKLDKTNLVHRDWFEDDGE